MDESGDSLMIPKRTKRPDKSLPYPFFQWTVLSLAFMGLADSIYLAVSHYRVYMDMGYRSFCAITKSINCDTVSQSHYAIFLGLPVPVWGIFGYLFIVLLMGIGRFAARDEKRIWPTIFFVSLAYSIYSIVLAGISTFLIQSYCLMCILSYAINLLLVFYSWLINNRFGSWGLMTGLGQDLGSMRVNRAKVLWILVPFLAVLMVVWTVFPRYWSFQPKTSTVDIPRGMTAEGDPWIGSLDPSLTIVEYTDYRCFQCKKMHFYLRDLIQRNPEAIRLVHRHFPMDKDFNPLVKEQVHAGSGRMALLAIYGASQDRFWQINDILFTLEKDHKQINMKELAKKSGLDTKDLVHKVGQPAFLRKLFEDITEGLSHGISGTPAYVIDDVVYTAQIPPDILKPYLR
jgi:uncharacterized membrane protein/protein-disulfide isomerase